MMALTRRSIMKLLGAAPVTLPSVASALPSVLARATTAVSAAGALGEPPAPIPQQYYGGIGQALGKQLDRLREQAHSEAYRMAAVRVGGLDPDIACLRSPSPAWKARKQLERLRAKYEIDVQIRRVLWG
jgi:hypothetical protein